MLCTNSYAAKKQPPLFFSKFLKTLFTVLTEIEIYIKSDFDDKSFGKLKTLFTFVVY